MAGALGTTPVSCETLCCVSIISFTLLLHLKIRRLNLSTGSIREEAGAKFANYRVKAWKVLFSCFNKAVCASQRDRVDQRA